LSRYEKANVGNGCSHHYNDPYCFAKIAEAVCSFISGTNRTASKNVVYICIGTDRATGDSLGPLVGAKLKRMLPFASIFGTLEEPVHAVNLQEVLANILDSYDKPLIMAVDACLGKLERVGFININSGGLKPGTALGKDLPEVGDFHISGVVNVGGFLEHIVLQNTRLCIVYKMADVIAKGLFLAHSRLYQTDVRDPLVRKEVP